MIFIQPQLKPQQQQQQKYRKRYLLPRPIIYVIFVTLGLSFLLNHKVLASPSPLDAVVLEPNNNGNNNQLPTPTPLVPKEDTGTKLTGKQLKEDDKKNNVVDANLGTGNNSKNVGVGVSLPTSLPISSKSTDDPIVTPQVGNNDNKLISTTTNHNTDKSTTNSTPTSTTTNPNTDNDSVPTLINSPASPSTNNKNNRVSDDEKKKQ